MRRRKFIKRLAQTAVVLSASSAFPARRGIGADVVSIAARPTQHLGVGMHSYGLQWNLAREHKSDARFHDALTFLEYCHALGAGGVQVAIGSPELAYTRRLRTRAARMGSRWFQSISNKTAARAIFGIAP